MNHDFFADLHRATPLCDKILALIGGATAGALTLGHLQAGVGIAVGIVTLLVMIPRAILVWRDFVRKIRSGEAATDDEEEDEAEE
jgi:hypothetical protein